MKMRSKYFLCAVPSLIGVLIFYIMPFLRAVYYSFINNQFEKKFVGLDNYFNVLKNNYFQLALKNSSLLILICVPVVVISSVLISIAMTYIHGINRIITYFFIVPIVVPTAAIVSIWHNIFDKFDSAIVIYILFTWKNIGICIILISAAISKVPVQIYQAAELDGANNFRKHFHITIPYILPSIVFSTLLTIVNSFRIFKESYLYYRTNYPPDHSYTLQYYMDNHFMKLNYQALSSAAVINMLIILGIIIIMLKLQRKYTI